MVFIICPVPVIVSTTYLEVKPDINVNISNAGTVYIFGIVVVKAEGRGFDSRWSDF
jgi:hypothetical protein